MVSKGQFPRFWNNQEALASADDWEPDEYLEWFQRLSDAKKELKAIYLEVDNEAHELVKELLDKLKEGTKLEYNSSICARKIVRYGAAYNFYNRMAFEDIPDSKAIQRVNKYLPRFRTGMHDWDIARMLQNSADKVPYTEAVTNMFTEFADFVDNSYDFLVEWYQGVTQGSSDSRFVQFLIWRAKKTGMPTLAEVPEIFGKVQSEPGDNGKKHITDKQLENAIKIMNSDERIHQLLTARFDPAFDSRPYYQRQERDCFKNLLASGKLGPVLDKIAEIEKEKVSWSKTVGPACVAIIRLGKKSAGQDFEKLAEYARKHAKRP